ncbi:peptidase S24-like protein [Methanobrevibacter cuticularis]|uniref:Peptidase S24-like protein n=1 Tax=Methanobrevibacter cuticularis TaxID=47311 RepID=A0A166CJM8_9EURY|nr:S24/S26 family peptidase [Methanobrevibacter cuticularis]KZX14877.1 peptidase S24-like protein [Methanobrevibacter cuticularis]
MNGIIQGGITIEKNKKIRIIILVIAIVAIAIGTAAYVFSDYVTIDLYLTGENATVNTLSFQVGKDIPKMEEEILNYSIHQMNNVDSDISSIKSGIREIAESYGFNNVNVNIKSQFGENQLPMSVLVDGISMVPTLKDGELIIIEKTNDIKVGDIIVAKDPEYGLLIKRVGIISGNNIFLASDNNDTVTVVENGVPTSMIAIEKWTNKTNVVGIARIFNVNE